MSRQAPLVALIVLIPAPALAQTYANVHRLAVGSYETPVSTLGSYAQLHHRGQYGPLAEALRRDLERAVFPETGPTPQFATNYVSISFVATPPTEKEPILLRILLPPTGGVLSQPFRLPGVGQLYDVFLTLDPGATWETVWTSTPEPPPIRIQLTKLAELTATPMAALIEGFALMGHTTDSPVTVWAIVDSVTLPHRRGLIRAVGRARNSVPVGTSTVQGAALALRQELERSTARISPCAALVAERLHASVGAAVTSSAPVLTLQERRQLAGTISGVSQTALGTSTCQQEASDGTNSEMRAAAVASVPQRYLGLVPVEGLQATSTSEIRNAPAQRVSIGLVGGAMISRGGATHHDIIDKALHPKPLTGLVTAAVVHFHPFSFDPTSTTPNPGERFSLFGGISMTPSAGFAAGMTVRFYRGLGIQASHVWLRANTLRSEYLPGDPAPVGKNPFQMGFSKVLTVGITYDMK